MGNLVKVGVDLALHVLQVLLDQPTEKFYLTVEYWSVHLAGVPKFLLNCLPLWKAIISKHGSEYLVLMRLASAVFIWIGSLLRFAFFAQISLHFGFHLVLVVRPLIGSWEEVLLMTGLLVMAGWSAVMIVFRRPFFIVSICVHFVFSSRSPVAIRRMFPVSFVASAVLIWISGPLVGTLVGIISMVIISVFSCVLFISLGPYPVSLIRVILVIVFAWPASSSWIRPLSRPPVSRVRSASRVTPRATGVWTVHALIFSKCLKLVDIHDWQYWLQSACHQINWHAKHFTVWKGHLLFG